MRTARSAGRFTTGPDIINRSSTYTDPLTVPALQMRVGPEDVPSSVELRWRPDSSSDVYEVILHEGSDSFADLALERGA
jgi:hypothetical protein